ncbi:MAG: hypothetical protein C0623_04725 [Desulfuromonas sp.]|nr:MAG: hypothetical protein C0623_04725 [Desulfuromonas sp.]
MAVRVERIEVGKQYPNNWKDRILMYGFSDEDVSFYSRMTDKEIYVTDCATDLIAFGARMALIQDGPQWQQEKWQIEEYLEDVGNRESCRFCVVQVL